MYESHFGLLRRPFLATPDPDCCVACESIENALAGLRLCIESRQGFGILAAPAGTGKTLVCRKLIVDLSEQFAGVFLANSNFPTRRSLLQAILYELGHPYLRMAEQELRLELKTAAMQVRPRKQAVLIVVDEAHLLSLQLLEELRTASNIDTEGTPLIQVVLSGQLLLEDKLADPQLEALNQRIGCQVTLEPLTRQESARYVAERLRWAGAEVESVFQPDALQMICHAADGLPRCLNQLCDHSLLLAYVSDERPVSAARVREALEDLKQLPLHWNEPLPASSPLEQLRGEAREKRSNGAGPDSDGIELGPDAHGLWHGLESMPQQHEAEPQQEEFPRGAHRSAAEAEEADVCGHECGAEFGEPSVVEIGGPFAAGDECRNENQWHGPETVSQHDSVPQHEAFVEVGATDAHEEDPLAATQDEIDDAETADAVDAKVSHVETMPQSAVPALGRRAIHSAVIGQGRLYSEGARGFEEEVVVDRYAMLDAGRQLPRRASTAGQASTAVRGAARGVASPSTQPGGTTLEQLEARLASLTACFEPGRRAGEGRNPEQLIDAIEPMIDEALQDDLMPHDDSWGTMTETLICPPAMEEEGEWAGSGIETDAAEAGATLDAGEPVEYDVVQPEQPGRRASSHSTAGESSAAQRSPGRYAHLFSKLRRRQRST